MPSPEAIESQRRTCLFEMQILEMEKWSHHQEKGGLLRNGKAIVLTIQCFPVTMSRFISFLNLWSFSFFTMFPTPKSFGFSWTCIALFLSILNLTQKMTLLHYLPPPEIFSCKVRWWTWNTCTEALVIVTKEEQVRNSFKQENYQQGLSRGWKNESEWYWTSLKT